MADQEWTPPPHGTPCWINIQATDVRRASTFYSSVFGWTMRAGDYGSEHMQHFTVPDSGCPGGGITKAAEKDFTQTHGKGSGGAILYMSVDSLDESAKKIIEAGGKQMTDIIPEGANAVMQCFEDTEGNYFGIHEWRGNRA